MRYSTSLKFQTTIYLKALHTEIEFLRFLEVKAMLLQTALTSSNSMYN